MNFADMAVGFMVNIVNMMMSIQMFQYLFGLILVAFVTSIIYTFLNIGRGKL